MKSVKHKLSKERLQRKEETERDIAKVLQASDRELHPRGETLPEEQRVYRVKVVRVFSAYCYSTEQAYPLSWTAGGECSSTF